MKAITRQAISVFKRLLVARKTLNNLNDELSFLVPLIPKEDLEEYVSATSTLKDEQ